MSTYQRVHHAFYPVGQGLFSSGQIVLESDKKKPFTWVYDCGTASEQMRIQESIALLAEKIPKRKNIKKRHLDLVVLSHFDADHISGIVKLLQTFSVDCLLLPYIPLEKRIAMAFIDGIDTQQSFIEFFINPVSYISNLENIDIKRIILVPVSDGQARPEDFTDDKFVDRQISTLPWEIDFDEKNDSDEDDFLEVNILKSKLKNQTIRISLLQVGAAIRAAQIWDFIPYNDASVSPPVNETFIDAVRKKRWALLYDDSDSARRAALLELRALYDLHFGRKQRNLSSLFLYVIPVRIVRSENIYIRKIHSGHPHPSILRQEIPFWWGRLSSRESREGILYTGDGYLDTNSRLDRLKNYFGSARMDRLGLLQVMHHGSEKNWHEGVAQALAPDFSFFCADPKHGYGHPHGNVVRDFLPHHPIIVDRSTGVTVSMSLTEAWSF